MASTCGICGSERSSLWVQKGEWHYICCTDCSAVWLDPPPAEGWAERFYSRAYFEGGGRGGYQDYLADEVQHRINAKARIGLARRFGAQPPAAWLDVGCAAGFTLDEARRAGFDPFGVDLSSWARDYAKARLGIDLFLTLADARRSLYGRSGVVSFFQALEHFPDPVAALADAHACIHPNGLLLIETWDRGSTVARIFRRYWQQITPPSVLWLFDRQNLSTALQRTGFSVLAIESTSKKLNVGWALGLVAEKMPRFFQPALLAIRRSGLSQQEFTYDLGDLISVVAVPAKLRDHHAT